MGGAVAQKLRTSQRHMFGGAACHAFAPLPKRRWLKVPAHQHHHGRFVEAVLDRYCFESGSIFPGHFDNARDFPIAMRWRLLRLAG
jgi:hypothetical protein